MNKAVFLDRDGVINQEIGRYVWKLEDFQLVGGIKDVLTELKNRGYLLIVITNQAGVAKGLYTNDDVNTIHQHIQKEVGNLINHFYHAPFHPDFSESFSRKPGSLLFEKAIAKFNIDPLNSWMVGDKERDLIPAKKFSIQTILVDNEYTESEFADYQIKQPSEMLKTILG